MSHCRIRLWTPIDTLKTNSEKIGYKPRGRKPGKRTDFMNDPAVIARRRQALSQQSAVEQGQPYPAQFNGG
ncbi:Mobile element protein (plasmid) [Sinorhizobium sp. CCBAU 05631]|nr:Mobile element protein [Sinorhizobium sp. CCBAU 05631]ASY74099.1 Mobile element protein [Sinorhizobium fredii CCBAU 83666]